jgi:hypothetical protein
MDTPITPCHTPLVMGHLILETGKDKYVLSIFNQPNELLTTKEISHGTVTQN